MIEYQLENIKDFFNVKMSRFLLIISEKSDKMSKVVFRFLLNNLDSQVVFYLLIENILKKTSNIDFLYRFWEFGKKKFIVDVKFGSHFCGVICNYLTYQLKEKGNQVKFYLDIDKQFFNKVLDKFNAKNFDYNLERFVILVLYYTE